MTTPNVTDRPGLLRVSFASEGVALVQMDDVAGKNALSHRMVDALGEAFSSLGRDDRVSAIVLAGLPEMFSSGASIDVLRDLVSGQRQPSEILLPRLMLECPVPCISAMEGHAVGGGFALGVAADLVLIARESRYTLNFLSLGFTPGMGSTALLEHILTPAIAHELLYTGEARLGRAFEGRSGINGILPRADVLKAAIDLGFRIAEKPRHAVVALKQALSLRRRQLFEAARTQETLMHGVSFAHPSTMELIETIFADNIDSGASGGTE